MRNNKMYDMGALKKYAAERQVSRDFIQRDLDNSFNEFVGEFGLKRAVGHFNDLVRKRSLRKGVSHGD